MSVGENIKRLRESHGLTQSQLGKIAGVSDKAVSTWEKDEKKPRMGSVQRMADYFKISKSALLFDDENSVATAVHAKGVRIPVLGDVAAGIPIDAIENIVDYEEIDAAMAATGEFFGLRIKGSSMEPRIREGDVVIVRKQEDADTGDTAVVLVNGDSATVKRIKKEPSGISLIPNNPAYDIRFYSAEEIDSLPVRIIGKVVELRGKF